MINRKIMVLTIILTCLLAISAVSASENVTEDIVSMEIPTDDSVGVENQDDNLISEIDDNTLTANPKTFTDLNNFINGNEDSDVYLESNYTFNTDSDSAFIEGIHINRGVTVHGNGYAIDGDNSASIFNVENGDVVFRDIVFVNGKSANDGGAIYGNCTVLNCTFIDNSAYSGGAVHLADSVVNCTFVGNSAQWNGGAITGASSVVNCTFVGNSAQGGGAISPGFGFMMDDAVVNCTFIGNSAYSGGALTQSNAVNCIFINNTASDKGGAMVTGSTLNCTFIGNFAEIDGGAIAHASSVVNCTFIDNSANEYGGAMLNGDLIVNCTFINNSANGDGGAIGSFEDSHVLNCVFINNTANNGGATFQVIVGKCNFVNNTARECGGAMIGGICVNSIFTDNHAGNDGGAIYDVTVENALFEYNSAENGGAMGKGKATNCTFNHNTANRYGGAVFDAKVSTNSQFNNNGGFDGNSTCEVTWFEKTNAKSFTDLKNLIEESGSDVYLNDNYVFDLSNDFELIHGIRIYSEVTIHGNGFTIDGNNLGRMFTASPIMEVVLKDTVFVNARTANEGGVIDHVHSVVNCTFINNSAGSGGTIYWGSVVNCTFINNSANFGGVMYNGVSVVNCTFVGNLAKGYAGGVMWNGNSVVNCTFINNSAAEYGGAIFDGSAVNCTFINNSANSGSGAMMGSAVNCIFINNSADNGGAMGGGSAVNCDFINNSADNGGAIAFVSAVNCTFINNTAATYGGATYYGNVKDCSFKGNIASIIGNDSYPAGLVLFVLDFTSPYKSGEKLMINFIDGDVPITAVEITIKIYKNDSLIGTYHCLSGDGWVVDLNPGNYTALISFEGNDNYAPRNATAKITIIPPPSSSLTIRDFNTTVGHEVSLVANVYSNITVNGGFVTFFDGDIQIGESWVYEGVASITYTPTAGGEHVLTAVFSSDNYLGSNGTAKLLVDSATVEVLVENGTVGLESKFVANVKGLYSTINEGTVTFYIDDAYVGSVSVVNGSASLGYVPFSAYNYAVKAVFDGGNFLNVENSVSYVVVPAKSIVSVGDVNGTVGRDIEIIVNVFSSNNLSVSEGTVTFFDGDIQIGESQVYDGVASFTYSPTTAGEHVLTVVFSSDNYLSFNGTARLLVDSATVEVLVENGTVGFESNFVASVRGLYSTIDEGTVTFCINDEYLGSVPVVNGSASLGYVPFTANNYTVKAVFEGGKFLSVEDTVSYTVGLPNSIVSVGDVNGTVGRDIVIGVNVFSSNNLSVSEGTVTFFDGDVQIGESWVYDGVASFTYVPTIAGERVITVVFSSDNYLSSNGTARLLVDSVTVDVVVDNGTVGLESNFVANVKGLYSTVNEGWVTFYIDGESLGSIFVVNGSASITYVPSKVGMHTLSAFYEGASIYPASNYTTTFEVTEDNVSQNDTNGTVFKLDSELSVTVLDVDVGETVVVNVSINGKATGDVVLSFNGVDNVVSISDGKGHFRISDLAEGSYGVVVRFVGDDCFNASEMSVSFNVNGVESPVNNTNSSTGNATGENVTDNSTNVTVVKLDPELSVSVLDVDVGEVVEVYVSVNENVTGDVILSFNGTTYIILISDGKGYHGIPYLDEGTYSVVVRFVGDDCFNASEMSVSFNVNGVATPVNNTNASSGNETNGTVTKLDSELSVSVLDVDVGETVLVNVSINGKATGKVVLSFNGVDNVVSISEGKGSFSISDLAEGSYGLVVMFVGDNHFLASEKSVSFKVNSVAAPTNNTNGTGNNDTVEPEITILPLDNPSDDESVTVTLPGDATGTVTLTINNKDYTFDVVNGVANVVIPDLGEGNYPYTIIYSGDSKYSSFTNAGTLTKEAPKVDPVILAKDTSVLYTANGKYSVTVYGTDGKVTQGILLVFKINNKQVGKAYTNENGVATYTVKNVPGTYNIVATALGISVTKKLTVKHVVTLKTLTLKKSAKKLTLQATLAKVNGKYLKKKTVTFKINGKKVATAKTNNKGVAKITINNPNAVKNLKVGKKATYQATYMKDTVKKTTKIKK